MNIIEKKLIAWRVKNFIKNARGKDMQSTVGKILKFLDGWKLVIGVVILAGTKTWDMAHNGHTGDYIGIVLNLLGWSPSGDWGTVALDAAGPIMILVGIVGKLVKAQQQLRAGTPVSGLLSTQGYVNSYLKTGKE